MRSSNNDLDSFTFSRYNHFTNIYLNSIQLERESRVYRFFSEFLREFSVSVMRHRPAPNSPGMKFQTKKFKLTPLEYLKTHSLDEMHPTHRQDIGKVSK